MNHTKIELEQMSLDELNALAKSLNAVPSKDKTELIYNIIDAESMQAIPSEKPKRSRKAKEEKPDAEKEKASTPKKRSRKSNEKAAAEETKAEESKSDNTVEETPAEPLAAPAPEKKRRRRISEVKAEAAAAPVSPQLNTMIKRASNIILHNPEHTVTASPSAGFSAVTKKS